MMRSSSPPVSAQFNKTQTLPPAVPVACCAAQVRLGEHNIVPNYFEQNQAEALDLNENVLNTLVGSAPDAKVNDLKQLLGRMLFSGNAMEKKVRTCECLCVRLWRGVPPA
jgi:ATPase subunit of ABC transporter with duplicated ATPase domains